MSLGLDLFFKEVLTNPTQSYGSESYGAGIKVSAPLMDGVTSEAHYSLVNQSVSLTPTLMACIPPNATTTCPSVAVKQAVLNGPQWVSTVGSTLTYSSLDNPKSPACRHPISVTIQHVPPIRHSRIRHRPYDEPMVLRFDRQHLLDKFVGLLRMGSHNAGDETHIDGGSLGIAQRAELTEGAHRGGNLDKIRFCPISIDPPQYRIRRAQIGCATRDGRCRPAKQDGAGESPHQATHVPSVVTGPLLPRQEYDCRPGNLRDRHTA